MSKVEQPVLVLLEHDGREVKPASLRAISAAKQLAASYSLLCIGNRIEPLAAKVSDLGAAKVFVADHEALAAPISDRYSHLIAAVASANDFQTVLATSTTFSRDLLPRVAALLDAPMLSDVTHIQSITTDIEYQRPVNAGCETATMTLQAARRVLTIRAGAFELPERVEHISPIEVSEVVPQDLPDTTRFVSREQRQSQRPDLSEARVVVAGGRPIKDLETFEQIVGNLADKLGGAVGATRALVDAGVVPNDWQIGQTGKVVAPELYVAVGISGAIQHLAGITESRVIVAINKDPSAPMMQFATYALAGDLFDLVPQFINALPRSE